MKSHIASDYDLCIIGGGINGAGIARDAAGRGLSVLLVEAQDLANATSSSSTKLIHGGLRYLEQYEFRLVRESLKERSVLMKAAPHIIWPMKFVLPHDYNIRPLWMVKIGLSLYDFLGGAGKNVFEKSCSFAFKDHILGEPIQESYTQGFSYSDCWVDDARLVVLNAVDAKLRGADVLTRTACIYAEPSRDKKSWVLTMRNTNSEEDFLVTADCVVNATGPWVQSFLESSCITGGKKPSPTIRMVKGSHIVVPKMYEGDQAYIVQLDDKRIIFVIPYEDHYSLIGTTEQDYEGDPQGASLDLEEQNYLLAAVNASFRKQLSPEEVVWAYSGVRPLVEDGEKNSKDVTRDYYLHSDIENGPMMLSVFGGKITTYRKLSEQAANIVSKHLGKKNKGWTAGVPLPGGDIMRPSFEDFLEEQKQNYRRLPPEMIIRCAHAYGTRMHEFLSTSQTVEELGQHYGDHVYEAEVRYLIESEFAQTADDILWRRTKLGLRVSAETYQNLENALSVM